MIIDDSVFLPDPSRMGEFNWILTDAGIFVFDDDLQEFRPVTEEDYIHDEEDKET